VGDRAAVIAGALMWIFPSFFVWYSTKISIYEGSLALSLTTTLLALQFRDGEDARWWPVAFGLAAGVSFWANPQTLFVLAPLGLLLLRRFLRRWRRLALALPFALVGAAPWFAFNLMHHWLSFEIPPGVAESAYLIRVRGFFSELPMALGLRQPWTQAWVFRPLAIVATAALVAVVLTVIALRPRRWWELAGIATLYPFAYAISPLSLYGGGEPRYLLMLLPVVCLLVARLATAAGAWAALGLLIAAAALTAYGVNHQLERHIGWMPASPDGIAVPPHFGDLVRLLDEHRIDRAYADYWVAFRATFETRERTIVSPIQGTLTRYEPYTKAVMASPRPAFIVIAGGQVSGSVEERFRRIGVPFERYERGPFIVFRAQRWVHRDDIAAAYGS
jgi:hypothetical protein